MAEIRMLKISFHEAARAGNLHGGN